jgi:hypothetical protein
MSMDVRGEGLHYIGVKNAATDRMLEMLMREETAGGMRPLRGRNAAERV